MNPFNQKTYFGKPLYFKILVLKPVKVYSSKKFSIKGAHQTDFINDENTTDTTWYIRNRKCCL